MKKSVWLKPGIGLSALGLLMLALPDAVEGPNVLGISQGHALSLLDSIAIIPLIAGVTLLEAGILINRQTLMEHLSKRPGKAILVLFGSGLGAGLLIASAFSGFYWWWAIGALIFAMLLLYAAHLIAS